MASNDTASGSVPGRLVASLREAVKERFIGLLTSLRPAKAQLLEDEQEVYLQVGRTVWHAPRQLRVELWLSSLTRRSTLVSDYQAYVSQEIAREASCDIDKDVQRTFPSTRRFHSEEGQTQLRNVLRAYAAYDPEVAYCQGMNFIAGLLLLYMPSEAHAFAALVVLMEDRGLRSFYHRSLSLLQVQLWQLSRLVSPRLNQHLEACGVVPMLYGASWLMTAFSADFPIPFSARIMDVLLADQCECALLKVAVAIMKTVEARLLDMHDLEDVLTHLKIEVPAWEEEELHAVLNTAFTKPWTPRQLSILSTTEGAETVAQAMDRVMGGPAGQQNGEDEDGGEDGCPDAEARVTTVTIPRLDPPPSFSASPACGTPILPGPFGTGSGGGAAVAPSGHGVGGGGVVGSGGSPPAMGMAPYGKCGSYGSGSSGGGGMLLGSGSPATWSIPSVHPNVIASPALSAFRRAHLPCFQPSSHLDKTGAPGHPPVPTRSLIRSVSAAASATASGNASYMSVGPDGPHPLSASGGSSAGPSAFAMHQHQHWRSSGTGGASGCLSPDGSAHGGSSWRISDARGQGLGEHPGEEEDSGDEWGDFSGSMTRQWRSACRSTPGSMNRRASHGMPLPGEGDGVQGQSSAQGQGTQPGAMHSCFSAAPTFGGMQPSPPHSPHARSGPVRLSAAQFWEDAGAEGRRGAGGGGGPSRLSQPIPVPWSHQPLSGRASYNSANGGACSGVGSTAGSGGGGPAAATAAAACGKPPLPPRSAFSDRAAAVAALGPYSRLSVVAEDPIAMQVGPVAPAPSPRGSMDMQAMGIGGAAAGSTGGGYGYGYAYGGYGSAGGEGGHSHYGGVLLPQYSGGGTVPFGGGSAGSTAAYGNSGTIDCGTGSGSGATGNALVSPSGVSGVVSPHALLSPRVGVSGTSVWYPGPAGGPRMTDGYDHDDDRGDGEGGDDDDSGYVPLDETGPGLCLERAASGLDGALLYDSAMPPAGSAAAPPPPYYRGSSFTSAVAPLLSAPLPALPPAPPPAPPANTAVGSAADTATDIAGDILRMLTAVDAGNANAAYDPRTLLGESMYADSPNREAHTLVRNDSQRLRHLPSSSALAEMAAQDLAKAQEEAERVRQELQAQLQQQHQQQQGSTASLDRSSSMGFAAGDVLAAHAAAEGPGHELGICGAEPVAPPGVGEQAAGVAEQSDSEFVLKRPTLYVDGIPMFDPKSLMADRGEAKPMFTPLVSPNAGGYAEQLATLTTPTGTSGAPTPAGGEHPFKDTQPAAAGGNEQGETAAPTAAAGNAEDTITTITITADSTVTTGAAAGAFGSARLSEGGAADAPAATASIGGGEPSGATASAADGDSAAAVAEAPAATEAKEAFEVDWSQAPPVPPPPPPLCTSPLRPSGGSGEAGAAPPVTPRGSASSVPSLARDSPVAAAGGGLDGAASSGAAGPAWLATVAAAAAAATADLISMQAQPTAAASAEAPRDGAAAAVTAAPAHRNGLSLIVPPVATSHSPFISPHSPPGRNYGILSAESAALVAASAAAASAVPAAAAAAAAGGSCLATLPYGLLPASSTVSVSAAPLVPSMASCRSMNVHLAGNSFSSTRSHPTEAQWMALNTDSAAPSEAGSRPVSRRWKDLPCDESTAGEAATMAHAAVLSRFFESRSYRGMASFHPGTGTVTEEDETAVDSPETSIAAAPEPATQGATAPSSPHAHAHSRPYPPRLVLPDELRRTSHAAPCSPTPLPAAPAVPPASTTPAPAAPSMGPSTPVVASVPAALSITSLEPADSAASASAVSAVPLSGASSAMADPFAGPTAQLDPAATPEPSSLGPASGVTARAEVEAEGSGQLDVDSADSRALSPSLAHHIMSAYLRSTAHQQQQEQLELEEQQQQRQPSAVGSAELAPELSLACGSQGGGLPAAPGSSGLPEVSSLSHGLVVPPLPTVTSNGAATTTTASHTNAPGADPIAIASPVLGSPTIAPPVSLAAATATAAVTAAPCKPTTPFAVRLEDPATCRLSAELLCVLPPPSLLQHPAPASPMQPSAGAGGLPPAACSRPAGGGDILSGGGASGGVSDGLLAARTSGVMPALGSGEVVFATAVAPAGHGVSSCPGAGGAAGGSHYPLTGYRSQEAPGSSGGGGHASALAALAASTHSFRVPCGSGGGASNGGACPLPLLRPPPAPAVPLSHTLGGAAAHTDQPAATAAASCPSTAAPALLQPSGSPSLCPVEASSISVPVLAPALPPAPQAPDWTATFDDPAAATATATCNGASSMGAGKQLGVGTGAGMGVGVRTPEASMRLPDLHVSPRASGGTHDASDRPAAMFVVEGMGGAPHGA